MAIQFDIPKGMDEESIARTFSAYLLGASAFVPRSEQMMGPTYNGEKWQLDDSNDYWLRFENGKARLSCRYPGQEEILQAMQSLFLLRHTWSTRVEA